MLNGRAMLLQILLVLFIVSAAFGQNVEVLKAELKGMEGRLDAKIDGTKDTLDAKIDGAKDTLDQKITGTKDELTTSITGIKDELTASINGVKSEVVTIKWIIGIAAGVFVTFLGFVGHLLNHYVKKVLPNTIQRGIPSLEQTKTSQPQPRATSESEFADSIEPDYGVSGGES